MPSPHSHSTTYDSTRIDGDAIAILGNVQGDIHFLGRPYEAGEISSNQCLRDLCVTDPREDRARIEGDKDRLLQECYAWILNDVNFQRWRTQDESRLLWIKGDPGKGKTMMMMGVIDELSQEYKVRLSRKMVKVFAKLKLGSQPCLVTYFFCQSTRPELNSAVSVVRGLIYLLVTQRPQLMQHVQRRYASIGKLSEGPNAIYALREMLSNILNDDSLPSTYLLIDALDECTSGLSELLHIITDVSLGRRSRVKWLVTSRNIPEIEHYLQPDLAGVKVNLEVKASYVSRAVAAFVGYKVQQLAIKYEYNSGLQAEVQQQLSDKAEGTFLWVSLVCKELGKVPLYRTREVLQALPPGLGPLYERMMADIVRQDLRTVEYCKSILRAITLAYRPLQLIELTVAACLPRDQFSDVQAVADLVSRCGSFLTVHEGVVSFIHLSAKDFFTTGSGRQVLDGPLEGEHGQLAHRLIDAMDSMLQRDMCSLHKPGARIQEAASRVQYSSLPQMAYACEYWVEHLQTGGHACSHMLADGGKVHGFFQKHLLHWLEAMSLLQKMSEAILALQKLEEGLDAAKGTITSKVVHDALRFAMWSGSGIQEAPLQVYYGALVFAPERSIVRHQFKQEMPKRVRVKCGLEEDWGPLLQTLEGHTGCVNSVAFSAAGDQLASASDDQMVRVWDAKTGQLLHTLKGHTGGVNSVAFSAVEDRLASASYDQTVRVWDSTGQLLHTLKGHTDGVNSVAFSAAEDRLASASWDDTVRVWDAKTGQPLHTLEGHANSITSVVFSAAGDQLASASYDQTVRVWDSTGQLLHTFEGHTDGVNSVAFSAAGDRLASASYDRTVRVWDTNSQPLHAFEGHTSGVTSMAFSAAGDRLASASYDQTVRVWDAKTGRLLHTLGGHTASVTSVAFSAAGDRLASASWDDTVRVWDAKTGQPLYTFENTDRIENLAFTSDGLYLKTDRGLMLLPSSAQSISALMSPPPIQRIFVSERWLTIDTEEMLWTPAEYQPSCTDAHSSQFVIGCSSGRVLFFDVS